MSAHNNLSRRRRHADDLGEAGVGGMRMENDVRVAFGSSGYIAIGSESHHTVMRRLWDVV